MAQPAVKQIQGTQERKALKPAMRGDASLNELSGNLWRIYVKADVEPAELDMHPTYWNSLADDVREADEVVAVWTNGKHFARYVIVNAQNGAVLARLAYAVEGAPIMSAVGPRAFPAGYHIARATAEEGVGYIVVRESDGRRLLTSGGVPWRSYQDAYTEFPKHAMFRNNEAARYTP